MSKNSIGLVAHFVAGYPSLEASFEVAMGLVAGGATALEMQIPYSDPSADGPVIEKACAQSLAGGFRVDEAFALAKRITEATDVPLFVMSYAGLVYARGITRFTQDAAQAGVMGLIVPDLVPGADEGFFAAAAAAGCPGVPVLVTDVSEQRLQEILHEPAQWLYVALRRGVTGAYTELDEAQKKFLGALRQREGERHQVMAGFGIREYSQVQILEGLVDAVVAGTALVSSVAAHPGEERMAAQNAAAHILGQK
ncbi:MAG: tryptophan synthase subunit alpha [Spirochaetales bacterium]|nr:tryptophan synthase subunit alpha [Spirochaetales bacterium]